MKLNPRQQITQFAHILQSSLFPVLQDELGELTVPARRLVATLEMTPLARFVPCGKGWVGRPSKDRLAIASAFVAKAIYAFGTTRALLDALATDTQLRKICGWNQAWQVPHEATFSRAFEEFAKMQLPSFVHDALIRESQEGRLIGHIARDATAIEARERFPETPAQRAERKARRKEERRKARQQACVADSGAPRPRCKPGPKPGPRGPHKRYPGGKKPHLPLPNSRLERQRSMSLPDMLKELPTQCDIGGKKNSKGNTMFWHGYKLHLDVADGQIPITAVLTSASVHDSQVAIPLAIMTSQRVTYCYELMDSAYDAHHIREQSRAMGHVPIIDPHLHASKETPFEPKAEKGLSPAEQQRYRERTMVERVNARVKDEFGGRTIRVRGHAKVMTHLMFGILALTVDQLLKLVVRRI
ncbi:MAG TPA: transposase [Candidatus Sulfopaludibacter sp.]|jgi:hypothetical protein|nr:transposase [Candidatus Sulfopaludibacter sp.]